MLSRYLPRSAASARLLLQLAAERGLDSAACLAGTGVHLTALDESGLEISSAAEERLIANIVAMDGPDSDFAVAAGRRYRLEIFGMLGFACMSAPTLREMLEISLRYQDLAFTLSRARLVRDGAVTFIELDTSHLDPAVRRFAAEQCIATVWTAVAEVDDAPPMPLIELSRPGDRERDYFRTILGVRARYGAGVDRIGFADGYLDRPRPQIDPSALALCEQQCRDMIARRRARVGTAGFVRELLGRASGCVPTMDLVAADLNMSIRTLRRALAAEGTSFRCLDEAVRRERSESLLRATVEPVDDIARDLGYSNTPAFVRAFKRWHGVPPGQWRSAGSVLTGSG